LNPKDFNGQSLQKEKNQKKLGTNKETGWLSDRSLETKRERDKEIRPQKKPNPNRERGGAFEAKNGHA